MQPWLACINYHPSLCLIARLLKPFPLALFYPKWTILKSATDRLPLASALQGFLVSLKLKLWFQGSLWGPKLSPPSLSRLLSSIFTNFADLSICPTHSLQESLCLHLLCPSSHIYMVCFYSSFVFFFNSYLFSVRFPCTPFRVTNLPLLPSYTQVLSSMWTHEFPSCPIIWPNERSDLFIYLLLVTYTFPFHFTFTPTRMAAPWRPRFLFVCLFVFSMLCQSHLVIVCQITYVHNLLSE